MADILPRIRITNTQPGIGGSTSPVKAEFDANRGREDSEADATLEGQAAPIDQHIRQVSDTNTNDTIIAPSNRNNIRPISNDERPTSQRSLDPLSEHILQRTGNAIGSQPAARGPEDKIMSYTTATNDTGAREARPSTDVGGADGHGRHPKEKMKGVAFLARFIANKKKEHPDDTAANSPELVDDRPEGADAEEFFQPVDNIGYNPRHPQPPPYIKVRGKYKKTREFNRLFLAQHLKDASSDATGREPTASSKLGRKASTPSNEGNAVWALEVSKDGKYLASTGQDKVVRIWSLLSTPQERRAFETAEDASMGALGHTHLSAPVFRNKPLRVFEGHEGAVLDLSWSKNNFLLSSSMDKTVRLWHVSRNECLCAFKHSDFVTSIQFHPKDDRFFLAGSLDSKLRLWSIPDKSIAFAHQLPDMVTAVAFTPDGKQAIAGCLSGLCMFYETEGLRYQTQIHVKSRTGKNAKGSKITGIQSMDMRPGKGSSDIKLLITSNDSRVRLYNLRDKALEMKFKGNENSSSQIHARFSDDARHIICGSEDKKVYIWSTTPSDLEKKDKWPVEVFDAHSAATTVSLLAPMRTRQLLGISEDPIFDICNPPPVQLVSRSEVAGSVQGDYASTKQSSDGINRRTSSPPTTSSAYIARSAHPNGNIIITADASGAIKIFRQDCAWKKRSRADAFSDASSMKRAGSTLMQRPSFANSSRHSSASLARQDSSASASTQHPRDRILSWRQSIGSGSTHSLDKSPALSTFSFTNAPRTSSPALPRHNGRSDSPRKSLSMTRGRFSRQSSAAGTPTLGADNSNSPSEHSPGRSTAAGSNINPGIRINGKYPGPKNDSSAAVAQPQPQQKQQRPANPERTDTNLYWVRDAWQEELRTQALAPHRTLDGASDSTGVSPNSRAVSRSPVRPPHSNLHPATDTARRPGSKDSKDPRLRPGLSNGGTPTGSEGSLPVSPGADADAGGAGGGLGFGARLQTVLSGWSALTDFRAEGNGGGGGDGEGQVEGGAVEGKE